MPKAPLRDLSAEAQRDLIGRAVTVRVYDDAESPEPSAVLHGRLAVLAVTPDITVALFEHQIGTPSTVTADKPMTVEWT